jgi:hypothetical protein
MYRGKFHDFFYGYGLMIYANNDEYDGQWKFGKRHGRAVFKEGSTGIVERRIYEDDNLIKVLDSRLHFMQAQF